MLISLRKHARYFYGLFVVVILAFVFWVPGGMGPGQQGRGTLATVGDEDIGELDFWNTFYRAEDRAKEQDKEMDAEAREQLKVDVLASLMEKSMLYQIATQEGVIVTGKEVEAAIKSEPAFQREGKFDSRYFDYILSQNRMDRKFYLNVRRQELAVEKMLSVVDNLVELSDQDVSSLKMLDPEKAREIEAQVLAGKRQAAERSYIEGLKANYPITYDLDLIKGK